jgi:ParB family transcriptional regulator, chromosome partitioning protein
MEKPLSSQDPAPKRKKLALGRGLEALIPDADPGTDPAPGEYFLCDLQLIRPNRFQPRRQFAETELEELAGSIREQGILQPLVVRRAESGFELIAGERRLRAARRAGLSQVPVVVRAVSDDQLLELSLVENIQRADLNPIEEAEAYHRLIHQFTLTQDQAAARVGKSRSAVANFLRLRQLPEPIQASIVESALSMGHARALLGAESPAQQLAAWRAVVAKKLSVRETEELVRRLKSQKKAPRVSLKSSEATYLTGLSEELSRHLGTKVTIRKSGRQGRLEIEFYSNDDLDLLITRLRQIRV